MKIWLYKEKDRPDKMEKSDNIATAMVSEFGRTARPVFNGHEIPGTGRVDTSKKRSDNPTSKKVM